MPLSRDEALFWGWGFLSIGLTLLLILMVDGSCMGLVPLGPFFFSGIAP